ncbi:Mediator of RNA polymerase II transcription subunit 11 [Pteropus alecto]|uniref:Mediator of RNA polymerase II transcription subunit 11 n=1 Tax=Pteropus alecto TaxID=9402 RepID=L5JZ37_PTEAL|nr:Mediator of RNA polymerase II transcription subunit 11 [Pteropus alecto]
MLCAGAKTTASSGFQSLISQKKKIRWVPRVTMATYSLANERLRALEDIEREIGAILQNAGWGYDDREEGSESTVILELSKEKTNERLLDRQAAAFTASVQHVEAELSAQIRYLTQVATGQPHEGSSYSSRKDCQMALKRVDYARLKLSDVARTCEQMLEN